MSQLLHFVVQRHKATHLHYDLRLEIDHALKSWAVPRGPSMNPHDHRLAVKVNDHPMLYRFYRGIVPGPIGGVKKRLGWRVVEIWDKGFYKPVEPNSAESFHEGIEKGKLIFIFFGKKLKGRFSLIKINKDHNAYRRGDEWILTKLPDKHAVHHKYDSEKLTSKFSIINFMKKNKNR